MAVTVGVGVETRWWEWREIVTPEQLSWLPCDYRLRDAAGVECLAVGVDTAPPIGWIRCDTEDPNSPVLPATVI
jgi:hypothetical protein